MAAQVEKVTAKMLLRALRVRFARDAVVREVNVDDPFAYGLKAKALQLSNPSIYTNEYICRHFPDDIVIPSTLPPDYSQRGNILNRRIDALVLSKQQLTAVEIKVTHADFLKDTLEKRRAWMRYTDRFVYLTPAGLIKDHEMPDSCGIWEFYPDRFTGRPIHGSGIYVRKRAKINKDRVELPPQVVNSMLYRVSNYERRYGK